jgi:hypothetical protein
MKTSGTTGTTGVTGGDNYATGTTGTTIGTAEGVAGPHSSRLANALDPRVDSDMDGPRRVGTTVGTTGVTGGNYNTGTTTGAVEGVAGPHSSRLANALDPRVDSDMDGSRRVGTTTGTTGTTGTYTTGTTGGLSNSTNAGPHNSNLANKLDPRVDSDLDGRGNRNGAATGGVFGAPGSHATPGRGTAQNTAGPHNVSYDHPLL